MLIQLLALLWLCVGASIGSVFDCMAEQFSEESMRVVLDLMDGGLCAHKDAMIIGADYYESVEQREALLAAGRIPIGIGQNSVISNTIVDKNARIGSDCQIVNSAGQVPSVLLCQCTSLVNHAGIFMQDLGASQLIVHTPGADDALLHGLWLPPEDMIVLLRLSSVRECICMAGLHAQCLPSSQQVQREDATAISAAVFLC